MGLRFKLPPGGDVPPIVAARRLGLTLDRFWEALPDLKERGFPQQDPTTGNFDLDAVDAWRRSRYPQLFQLTTAPSARDAKDVVEDRLAGIGRWAK